VHTVQGYARTAPVLTAPEQALLDQALAAPGRVGWVFSSSEAIDHLARLAPGADWSGALAWASHPRIAARARQLGVGRVLPVQPGLAALVAAARAEAAGCAGPPRSARLHGAVACPLPHRDGARGAPYNESQP